MIQQRGVGGEMMCCAGGDDCGVVDIVSGEAGVRGLPRGGDDCCCIGAAVGGAGPIVWF